MQAKDIFNNMMQFNALYNSLPSFPFSNTNYWNTIIMSSLKNNKFNISEEIGTKVEQISNKKVKIENLQYCNQENSKMTKENDNLTNHQQIDVKFDEIVKFSNKFSHEFEAQESKMKDVNNNNKEIKEQINSIFLDISFIKSKINQIKNVNPFVSTNSLSLLKRSNYLSDCFDQNSNNEDYIVQQLCRNSVFKYEIVLFSEFPKRVYRDRLFNFRVVLRDIITKETVHNKNDIKLDLKIFNAEECPKLIENNNFGKQLVEFNVESFFKDGFSKIEKIKIKEVSSHFLHGWVYLCVVARPSLTIKIENPIYDHHSLVYYKDIKPLVIQNVVIKSKKFKNWKD